MQSEELDEYILTVKTTEKEQINRLMCAVDAIAALYNIREYFHELRNDGLRDHMKKLSKDKLVDRIAEDVIDKMYEIDFNKVWN